MILLLILLLSSLAECHWIFEIELISYNNPTSKRQNGFCCDNGCGDCDNDFVFCLRNPDEVSCTYGRYQTGLVASNDDSLAFDDTIGSSNIPNPLIFNGTEWPNNNQLLLRIEVYDIDFLNSQYIGGISITYTPSSTNGSFIGFTARTIYFTLQTRYRFGCANFYYGSRCEVFCQPHNDDINGHYTCDTQGNIVCNTGYQMKETNCITPICQPSCGSNGQCISPDTCQCINGWTGPTCNVCTICSSTNILGMYSTTIPILNSTATAISTKETTTILPLTTTTVPISTITVFTRATTVLLPAVSTTANATSINQLMQLQILTISIPVAIGTVTLIVVALLLTLSVLLIRRKIHQLKKKPKIDYNNASLMDNAAYHHIVNNVAYHRVVNIVDNVAYQYHHIMDNVANHHVILEPDYLTYSEITTTVDKNYDYI